MKTFVREQIESDRFEVQEYSVGNVYYTPLFTDVAGVRLIQRLTSYDGFVQGVLDTKMSFAEAVDLGSKLLAAAMRHSPEPCKLPEELEQCLKIRVH